MALLIINQSVQKKDSEGYEKLLHLFKQKHTNGVVQVLENKTFEKGLAQQVKQAPVRVYVAGGDGTVNFVINQFVAHHPNLQSRHFGIIPFGSANGLATDLDLPSQPHQAFDALSDTKLSISADVPMIQTPNNPPTACVHFADAGINAQLVQQAEQNKLEGLTAYAAELPKAFFNRQQTQITLHTETDTCQWEGHMLIIALARKLGSDAVINPTGQLGDGLFEVGVVKPMELPDVFKITWNMFGNPKQNFEWMHMKSLAHAEIKLSQPTDFQIDGEYMGQVESIKVGLHSQKINWLVTDSCPYV